jgi:acyl carrier protein
MSDYENRLQRCFVLVFPALPADRLSDASVQSVGEWDSLANINLLSLIEEEFGIEIPTADLEGLTSFATILEYLRTRNLGRA